MKSTCYRSIENQDGTIQLSDLYLKGGKPDNKPHLFFAKAEHEACWDNTDYLIKFFRGIKKNKEEYLKELKQFCTREHLEYEITLRELLDIYSDSKKLNFWCEIKPKDLWNKTKKKVLEEVILEHQKPNFHQYLISIGKNLNNYSYDPIKVLNSVHYFADCYNKDVKVQIALDNFSEI